MSTVWVLTDNDNGGNQPLTLVSIWVNKPEQNSLSDFINEVYDVDSREEAEKHSEKLFSIGFTRIKGTSVKLTEIREGKLFS